MMKIKWNTKSCLQMFEFFFQAIIYFFSDAKPFLQGVEFSKDLQAFETFFSGLNYGKETGSISHYPCSPWSPWRGGLLMREPSKLSWEGGIPSQVQSENV